MAWLFGSGKRSPTGQTEIKVARDRQIANLHERVPGLQVKSSDNSLYEVQLKAPPEGAIVMLRVFLPTKFPAERPVLQLLSSVSHPWVNQFMQVVGHPDLQGWDGTNPTMIGDIVAAVIREFGRGVSGGGPPGRDQASTSWGGQRAQTAGYLAAQPAPGSYSMGSNPAAQPTSRLYGIGSNPNLGSCNTRVGVGEIPLDGQGRVNINVAGDLHSSKQKQGRDAHPRNSRGKPKDHTPIPAIPTKFDEVEGLPMQELNRLLEDSDARQALLLGMTSVAEMKDLRTEVRKGNVETARLAISKQEIARVLREEGERMRLELKNLQTSYEGRAQGNNKNMGGTADQVILKQVKHASKMADGGSERVANNFLEKRLPAQDFLEEFIKERQRYHMLAAKIECMKRDIRF